MKTFKTIHDLIDATASNYLCAVESTTDRVINVYMPNGIYNDLKDVEDDILSGLGEAYDNVEAVESGEIEDIDGLFKRINEAHILLLEAYRDAIRLANKK